MKHFAKLMLFGPNMVVHGVYHASAWCGVAAGLGQIQRGFSTVAAHFQQCAVGRLFAAVSVQGIRFVVGEKAFYFRNINGQRNGHGGHRSLKMRNLSQTATVGQLTILSAFPWQWLGPYSMPSFAFYLR